MVLTLIAVLTAVILPEMRGTLEESALRSTARELVSACRAANSRAIATGRPHRLVVDSARHRFRVEASRNDARPTAAPGTGSQEGRGSRAAADPESGVLDPRIAVELRLQEPPATGAPDGIEFRADGTAAAADILLRDRTGFGLALRLNPITARASLKELQRP